MEPVRLVEGRLGGDAVEEEGVEEDAVFLGEARKEAIKANDLEEAQSIVAALKDVEETATAKKVAQGSIKPPTKCSPNPNC